MKEIILDDKMLITEALCDLLKMTRDCANLESLIYVRDEVTLEERVHAIWKGDYHNEIDVTADSGIGLIRDVCKAI